PDAEFQVVLSKGCSDISWSLDGIAIEESANFLIRASPDGKEHFLTIKNCQVKQSGQKVQFVLNKFNKRNEATLIIEEISKDFLVKVRRPLEDVRTKERESCSFTCGIQISAILSKVNVPLEIKWFKNKEEILNSERYIVTEEIDKNLRTEKLEITNCTLEDCADFVCKIYLKLSEELMPMLESKASLFVKELDAQLLEPLPSCVEIFSGQDLALKCQISKANLPVEWLKDNVKIAGPKYDTIINQIDNDRYSYELIAKSLEFTNSSSRFKLVCRNFQTECKVTVKKPKLEVVEPLEKKIYVDHNQTGVLRTKFSSRIDDDLVRLELYKNSKRIYFSNKSPKYQLIVNENALDFFIKDFGNEDQAKYELKVCTLNDDDNIVQQTECLLNPNDLKVIKQLNHLDINEPQTAKFELTASRPCKCEWYFTQNEDTWKSIVEKGEQNLINLEKILPNDRVSTMSSDSDNSFSLIVEKTKIADSGRYIAVLYSDHANLVFCSAILRVTAVPDDDGESKKPVIVRDLPSEVEGFVSEPFSISLSVKGDNLQIEWFNGEKKVIALMDQVQVVRKDEKCDLVFNFNQPFSFDSGDYFCKVSNGFGAVESRCCRVTIKDPSVQSIEESDSIFETKPRFIEYFSDVYVEPHTEAQFKCKIMGRPEPKVTWFCNCRKLLSHDQKFECLKEADYYTLVVKNIGLDDEGEYSCKASNCKGEASWAANLYLNDCFSRKKVESGCSLVAPNFLRKIRDSTVLQKNTAKLDCFVD
ncbi:muscle M-line assembly unc-89 isoform X7, partial [Brachionus plicatilis]